jgi:hypothetical protein
MAMRRALPSAGRLTPSRQIEVKLTDIVVATTDDFFGRPPMLIYQLVKEEEENSMLALVSYVLPFSRPPTIYFAELLC